MKKILYFFLLFLAVIGLLGGIGYTLWCNAVPIAVGIGVLGYMAYPMAKEWYNKLFENDKTE